MLLRAAVSADEVSYPTTLRFRRPRRDRVVRTSGVRQLETRDSPSVGSTGKASPRMGRSGGSVEEPRTLGTASSASTGSSPFDDTTTPAEPVPSRSCEMRERLEKLSEAENKQKWLYVTETTSKAFPAFRFRKSCTNQHLRPDLKSLHQSSKFLKFMVCMLLALCLSLVKRFTHCTMFLLILLGELLGYMSTITSCLLPKSSLNASCILHFSMEDYGKHHTFAN